VIQVKSNFIQSI